MDVAGALLRQTGDVAEERSARNLARTDAFVRSSRLPRSGIRAECGDLPRSCENLPLDHDQIKILASDVGKLFKAIVKAFDLQDAPTSAAPSVQYADLGDTNCAGVGFPMFLGLPERHRPACVNSLKLRLAPGPKVLLVPYRSVVGPNWQHI